MLLSLNFLRDYIDLDKNIDIKELAEKMTSLGNEYDFAGNLLGGDKLIIGEVLECEDHPDSDHLHVCKVNIGDEILQIVCGAKNVRKGLKVIVALVGCKLPEIEIKQSTIRGVDSCGMLCSMLELGLDFKFADEVDKVGIHELPADAPVGENPLEYMGFDDKIIDFELTSNRGDLLSVLGMAYEVASVYGNEVKLPNMNYDESGNDINDGFKVNINTENCKLFLAKRVNNVNIHESNQAMKERLIASGIRPINNVVDISNYVMMELGQPLHFYDADKLKNVLEVRMAENNEKLITLDNIERVLSSDDIVISDGDRAIGLAGVMGGIDTEVTAETKNIIIEAAIFDNVKVRKTSNKILRSEASNRFEKGLDPNRTYMAMDRACNLLQEFADGNVNTGMVIYDKTDKSNKVIDITVENINNILGASISKNEIVQIFNKLGFEVEVLDNLLRVTVPTRRIDISIKEDLIEEVGRIYGVDNIESRVKMMPMKKGSYDRTQRQIRNKLVDLGLNETLTYCLVSDEEADMFDNDKNHESISVLTPIVIDRKSLRKSIITSLLKVYNYNKAYDASDISLFEIGKSFYKRGEEDFVEESKLGVLMSGNYTLGLKQLNVDFYVVKGIAEESRDFLGCAGRYSFIVNDNIASELHPGKSAVISVNNDVVGFVGRIHPSICGDEVYVMEINLDKLLQKKVGKMQYKEYSKFLTVKKDIAVVVDKNIEAIELQKVIKTSGGKLVKDSTVFDVYTGKGIDDNKKSIAFKLEIGSDKETLTAEQINEVLDKVIGQLKNKFGAELR